MKKIIAVFGFMVFGAVLWSAYGNNVKSQTANILRNMANEIGFFEGRQ